MIRARPDIPGTATITRLLVPSLRVITVLTMAIAAIVYIVVSLHWRMAVDTPVMHYVVFLMHHGLKPYTGITDNNMPGAYLSEAAAMAVFGGSDLSWRIYEFFLFALLAASAVVITRRWDPVAGIFGAGLFLTLHSAEGPQLAVERDFVIGILLVVSTALLFLSVDRRRPALLVLFGLLTGLAATIKPTVLPFPLVFLAIAAVHLRKERAPLAPYVGWTCTGLLLAFLAVVGFLSFFHAWQGFFFILRRVLPAYGGLSRMPLPRMLHMLMPRAILLLATATLPLFVRSLLRRRYDWHMGCLVAGLLFGFLSYMAQGKGSVYHRYIFLLYLLLLVGVAIFNALREHGWPRWLAAAALLLGLSAAPGHLRSAHALVGQSAFELTLERDLQQIGAPADLNGHVACFDLVYGCLDALYHLHLVDNAGFTGDMLFFAPKISPPVLFYRDRFWRYANADPASVVVVSNGFYAEQNSYTKLDRWPELKQYLADQYTLVLQRSFPHERYGYYSAAPFSAEEQDSYRLYIRNGSPLLANARHLTPAPVSVGDR